jgi:hypothetical protein
MRVSCLCAPLILSLVTLSILQAQTEPTFNRETYASKTGAVFGAKADLNNDGVPDLVLCCDSSRNVWYQLSTGTGAFLAPVTLGPIFQFGGSIATGDFNKSGRTDVAVPALSGITIYYNQGDGIFAPKNYFAGSNMREVAVADFNHDNNLDIAFTPNKQGAPVQVALGDGTGHFANPTMAYSSNTQLGASALVVGDFDGDHNADLGFLLQTCRNGGCYPSQVVILYGQGDGMFTAKTFPNDFFLLGVSSFDVNRTGRSDLTIVTSCSVHSCEEWIGVLFGTGSRTLRQALTQPEQFEGRPLGVADLNGDLKTDLIQGLIDRTLLALATSASSWDTHVYVPVSDSGVSFFTAGVLVGDFNRDRKPDVVLYSPDSDLIVELVNTTATGNYGACSYPHTGQGIHVCSPTSGSTRHSPVRFTAAANSFQPIRKVELWIDGHKIKQQFSSWLDFTTTVTPGTHKATIFANGYDDDFQRTPFLFTVN